MDKTQQQFSKPTTEELKKFVEVPTFIPKLHAKSSAAQALHKQSPSCLLHCAKWHAEVFINEAFSLNLVLFLH